MAAVETPQLAGVLGGNTPGDLRAVQTLQLAGVLGGNTPGDLRAVQTLQLAGVFRGKHTWGPEGSLDTTAGRGVQGETHLGS